MATAAAAGRAAPGPGQIEFIALMAMLAATVAFSIDAVLPALGDIAEEMSPDAPNLAQFVLTAFVLGMGAGTFLAGPLSDAIGRRPTVALGAALYCAGAGWGFFAQTLEGLLLARLIQGIGAAGPRVTMLAIVRDRHSGPEMARIMSFVMTVFALVPAVAPLLGAGIIAVTGWRGVFGAFLVFSAISVGWLWLRLPESLPPPRRRPIRPALLMAALRETLSNPRVRRAIIVQMLAFAALFATLSSLPYVFEEPYGRGASLALWFAALAVLSAGGSLLNARLVGRLPLGWIVTGTMAVLAVLSFLAAALASAGALPFPAFWLWGVSVFFMAGLVMGNVNTIALEPLPHVAGLATSVVASLATVGAVALAAPVGLLYDGTPVPLTLGVGAMAGAGAWLARRL
ncbi:DHA1 family bicyclomycin/chloramphenicol resistance-like MFS transporter [Hasllibacter halocynthiae]|uniref:DHA1 family bicyclomycin/chloramphenicol resistance-like MFS transporter n=1 Tax=Hasllibacter halocynthiae TaxID=595589 RepID=A0A2T0X8G0_9RHOB|nr:MFS transporter [Hasllibacter halocynthiae]PRY95154.1 DHA1 family bicyclomycin/chloramphenicol resistance-like MFS transporter [Hasllibacter halocynthiae]